MSFFTEYWHLLCEGLSDNKNIAVLGGSFKLPHKGHYAKIKHYSDLVGQDGNVLVFISKSSPKNERPSANEKPIPAELVKQVLEIYCSDLPNVSFEIAEVSPIKSSCDLGDRLGDEKVTLICGCSNKEEDLKRWKKVKDYIESRHDNIYVVDPLTTAAPSALEEGGAVSAADFRNSFGDIDKMITFMPDHLDNGTKVKIAKMLLAQ